MRSMTGFGAAEAAVAGGCVTVEVRAVNHRFLDARVALPREFGRWEGEIRELIRSVAGRGRVEMIVTRSPVIGTRRARVEIRSDVARAFVRALRELKRELRLAGDVDVGALTRVPDLIRVIEAPVDPAREIAVVRRTVRRALAALASDRRREGGYLERDMRKRVRRLQRLVVRLRRTLPHVVREIARRAGERMRRLGGGVEIDPQRLLQEVAVLAERADVTEEIVRLGSHLDTLGELLAEATPVGKRIEFLLQEMNREINTVGSKVGDLRVADVVLQAKAELEKLREQVQNVE